MSVKPKLYLINGPLGAGKTTVLKHILSLPDFKTARIIENEFASTSVDTDQLHDHHAEVKTIAGICICCSTGDELTDALTTLSVSSEAVIIEATGVANSLKLIEKIVLSDMIDAYDIAHALFVLDGVEAVSDLDATIAKYATELKGADTVLVSKTDMLSQLSKETLSKKLSKIGLIDVEFAVEGVFDAERLTKPSSILQYFSRLDEVIDNHDEAFNYTIIDTEKMKFDVGVIDQLWSDLVSAFRLRRLKGDIYDHEGTMWHVEATPSQLRTSKGTATSARLVLIGKDARLANEQSISEYM